MSGPIHDGSVEIPGNWLIVLKGKRVKDLLGHSKPGVTTVYARATHTALEAAEKLIEPIGQVASSS